MINLKNLNYYSNDLKSLCSNSKIENLSMSKLDIVRAFVNVGYPKQFYGAFNSVKINRYLKVLGILHLFTRKNGFFRLKDFVYDLDTSEKQLLSYELGMIFAQIIGEKKLKINWTLHYNNIKKSFNIEITKLSKHNEKKPDLIALKVDKNTDKYLVIEAKGTLGNCKKETIKEAYKQLSVIKRINGIKPSKYISYLIAQRNRNILLNLIDPEEETGDYFKIEKSFFIKESYRNLVESLIEAEKKDVLKSQLISFKKEKYSFKGFVLKNTNIFIGIEENIFSILRNIYIQEKILPDKEIKVIEEVIKNLLVIEESQKNDLNISIGNNGVVVKHIRDEK